MSDEKAPSQSRRQLFKSLSLVPIAAAGIAGCARETDKPAEQNSQGAYQPGFFNAAEWAILLAACDREAGNLELENISAKEFFGQLLSETRLGGALETQPKLHASN